jgi:carbon storage regulator CsrA
MLVLTRQAGQWLRIGADVRVQVVHARHGRVLLGVEAPRAVAVLREELVAGEPQPQREKENQKERDQDLRPSYSNSSTVSPYPELEIEEPRKLYEFEFEFERGARTVSARGEPRMTTDPVSTSGSTSMGARQSSSSTSLSGVGPDGAALAFYESLLALLPARSISDLTCFRRVAEWLADGVAGGRFRPDVFARVLLYAREAREVRARNRNALFMGILRKEMDYVPKQRV